MNLTELQDMISNDSKIDPLKLDSESLNTALIQSKYIKLYSNENRRLKILKIKYDKLKLHKFNLIMGRANPKDQFESDLGNISMPKTEAWIYVESLNDIIEIKKDILEQESKIDLLSSFIQVLNQRSFQIKNAIEYRKFMNGLN